MDYMPYVKPEDEDSSSDEEFDYDDRTRSSVAGQGDFGYRQDDLMDNFDYYEHQDLDLYGDAANDNNLNLYG
ncbi:unnamed protein product [Ambrosiozyma monospora]|uniref:Unnamed protein product n=1 Tax=Ambrosiozyma monospora TaxID=43982 RepID=A0ACB5TIK6_AMBMO|nr:unnamed protein product [Ambrosiozyma monospora]